jgi:hypothetical protein
MQLHSLCEQEKTHFRGTERGMEVCVVNVEAAFPQFFSLHQLEKNSSSLLYKSA